LDSVVLSLSSLHLCFSILPSTTGPSTLSLHDALPISVRAVRDQHPDVTEIDLVREQLQDEYDILEELGRGGMAIVFKDVVLEDRSEEHTSELQSRFDLVCRLLLEKKKKHTVRLRKSLL